MVTEGQREGVEGLKTGERTAGQQETRTVGTGFTGDRRTAEGRRTGQRETVTDRETGTGTRGQGQQDRRQGAGEDRRQEDSRTGGLKRTSTVIVMQ